MQKRTQIINGREVTVLVSDEDVESFDAAQKPQRKRAKASDVENKARKNVSDK